MWKEQYLHSAPPGESMSSPPRLIFLMTSENFPHEERTKPERGFVEKHDLWMGHQGTTHDQHLSFSAGEIAAHLSSKVFQSREVVVDLFKIF